MKKKIFFAFFVTVCLFVLLLFCISFVSSQSAQTIDGKIVFPIRSLLRSLFSLIPFALFEVLLLFFPIVFIAILKRMKQKHFFNFTSALILFVASMYAINIGIPSNASVPVLTKRLPGECDLMYAAVKLSEKINFTDAAPVSVNHGKTDSFYAKKSIMSKFYTMLGISGEYYFLTSESSVNTELPDYLQVFSSMHEYMHFLGVMREDEANFYAYVALTKSDNAYYNYCAYVYAYELVLASLSRTYREEFEKLYAELPLYVQNSFEEHRKFNLKHESSLIGKLSKYLNTKAISLRDSRGTSSYSRSVYLIVDYICSFGT